MTPDKLNASLIDVMREKIPDGVNLANVLMDILSIGKEAVYRRFRGEVPFTLSEAVLISQKLGVSIDKLTGMTFGGETLFDINLFQMDNPIATYYATIENYIYVFRNINPDHSLELWDCTNRISLLHCFPYENLTKFHLFKWLYQRDAIQCNNRVHCFDEMETDPWMAGKQQEILEAIKKYKYNNYIWDPMVFLSLIHDLRYFKEIDMISKGKMEEIKEELIDLINEMETAATKGTLRSGNKVQIFISSVNFETSYSYIETKEEKVSFIKVYDLNTITSRDERVFESLKRWMNSLKKFSILISQSAEMERYKFFETQREYANSL